MKKLFVTLFVLAVGMTSAAMASAQYYNSNYYSTSYVPSTSYQYSYGLAIGSYTIGCTTHYYNTTTGTVTRTQNICTTTSPSVYVPPTYAYPASYTYPVNYSYPVQYSYPANSTYTPYNQYGYTTYNNSGYGYNTSSQYCTYGYANGVWTPCTGSSLYSNSNLYGGTYGSGYQDYLNCHYDTYGQYVCY